MSKEMYISSSPHETKVAVLEDDQLVEVYFERDTDVGLVGGIYKGRVSRVLPGMQSAFVDIGLERDAFLYVSDFFYEDQEEYDKVFEEAEARATKLTAEEAAAPAVPVPDTVPAVETEPVVPEEAASSAEAPAATPVEPAVPVVQSAIAALPPTPREFDHRPFDRGRGRRRRHRGRPDFGEARHGERRFPAPSRDESPADAQSFEILPGESLAKYSHAGSDNNPQIPEQAHESPTSEGGSPDDILTEASSLVPPLPEVAPSGDSSENAQLGSADEPSHHGVMGAVDKDAGNALVEDKTSEPSSEAKEAGIAKRAAEISQRDTMSFVPSAAGPMAADETLFHPGAIYSGATSVPVKNAAGNVSPAPQPTAPASAGAAVPPYEGPATTAEPVTATASITSEAVPAPELVSKANVVAPPATTETERQAGARPFDPAAPGQESPSGQADAEVSEDDLEDEAELEEVEDLAEVVEADEVLPEGEFREIAAAASEGQPADTETEAAPAAEAPNATGDRAYTLREPHQRPRFAPRRRRGRRGQGAARRFDRPRESSRPGNNTSVQIAEVLKEGQEILVQIAKEPLGSKGARITSHVALPGRYLVYMPTIDHIGVSRKIASEEERLRLRNIILENKGALTGGFIVRTAGQGRSEDEFKADLKFLSTLWSEIRAKADRLKAPALIHRDLDLVQRLLRDLLTPDFKLVRVDSEIDYERVLDFVNRCQPALIGKVKLYSRDTPLYEEFGIQAELDKALKPKVWLKSGGYIVINQTEALVAVDVNTGKYVGKTNRLEDTIVKTNIDAVNEIVRQVRLRDLGGIIVIDFIDMDERKNRAKVVQALEAALHSDRAPTKVISFHDFGLVAVTRKRVKQSLERTLCEPCDYCAGSGWVKSVNTVCNEILSEARKMAKAIDGDVMTLRVNPEVAKALKSREGNLISELEAITKKDVIIKGDPSVHQERFEIF